MLGILFVTAFEVAQPTGFIMYHILERACIEAELLRVHLSSGFVGKLRCIVFHRCASKGIPWIYSYIKQYWKDW